MCQLTRIIWPSGKKVGGFSASDFSSYWVRSEHTLYSTVRTKTRHKGPRDLEGRGPLTELERQIASMRGVTKDSAPNFR